MKLMIASDIHGSAYWCKKLLDAYRKEQPDKLLLLGDLLYHGPRNDLPDGYAPKEVIALLNEMKAHLLCVRGNCEAEVDQMVLQFPVMADYCVLFENGHTLYLTHGHLHGESNPPPLM
ncbi:MAG: phosphodiesterase, partial [Clostridia bacterium]|nr:phosphodiesterase [Clostridia bacterium]